MKDQAHRGHSSAHRKQVISFPTLFLQVWGAAPNYANLFLALWEKDAICHNNHSDNLKCWGQYIDNVLLFGLVLRRNYYCHTIFEYQQQKHENVY